MVGQNIGKYRVLDRIGRGGMGTVYRAIDETLHREVAIKVLNAELNDPEVAKRFRAEAITVARLSHPGIATIYELFQHDGQWLMVMEYVRGETLEHMVERMGATSPQRAAELCMQALAALAHAHSMGVVHRDLKPANLMITETGAVKIMDFGIARVAGTEHLTNAGFMMGTPAYMAPEQVMGHEIDARADLYAMGVVFYRLTTGKLPFKGETPFAMAQSQVNDVPTPIGMFRNDVPAWVQQVVVRSLAKSPEERFQSAVEFHESFARCLAGLPMTSMYNSSALTELMMTPPRAMPTGSIPRTITSAQLPVSTEATSAPTTMQSQTPTGMPSQAQTPMNMPTQAHTPMGVPAQPLAADVSAFDASMTPTILGPSGRMPTVDETAPVVRTPTGANAASPSAHATTGATVGRPGTGAMATAPSTAPVPLVSPGTGSVPVLGDATPTAPLSGATGSVAAGTAAAAMLPEAGASASQAVPSPTAKARTEKGAKKSGSGALVAAAVAVLIAGLGATFWFRGHRPPVAESVQDTTVTPGTEVPGSGTDINGLSTVALPGGPPSAAPPPSTPSTPASGASKGPSRAGTAAPASTPLAAEVPVASTPSVVNAAPVATPTPKAAAPPIDDTHQAFSDVKVLVVNGKKSDDEDVLLSFVGGQISVLGKKSGTAIASVPYKNVLHATYVHARDPRWDESFVSPPKDLDVGGMLRTSKHWLVLQTKDNYFILRLSDSGTTKNLNVPTTAAAYTDLFPAGPLTLKATASGTEVQRTGSLAPAV
ncbi:MAG: protein kinase, partial [Acidobacteriota bacterium]